ncbi:hypothetical protein BGZ65_008818 [Modicella reniformis]|uniref:Uncharacterized protein n=1 Tax=Modicella reniformis TaxID=1440133 RepID=A0A9P6IU38_9FUNG|nr:hypothetical protein BGZ65_008818 [Modicella reniformis]
MSYKDGISVAAEFQGGSISPILSTNVTMERERLPQDPTYFSQVFQDYGWSISILKADYWFTDDLAEKLNQTTEEKGSKITFLSLNPSSLTSKGVECMIKVIDRSQGLQRLLFTFKNVHKKQVQENLKQLISRYCKRVNGLKLQGYSAHVWISQIKALCPTRLDLPELESFAMTSDGNGQLSPECVQWIAAIVTPSSQGVVVMPMSSDSTQLSTTTTTTMTATTTMMTAMTTAMTTTEMMSTSTSEESSTCPLSDIQLTDIPLQSEEWQVVIKALNNSTTLKELYLGSPNFSMDNFKLLVDCIPANSNPVFRLCINIRSPYLERSDEWKSEVARLCDKLD